VHGFFRDSDGTLIFPIDPPGATATLLFGLNDRSWMVGRYSDSAGVFHAIFYQTLNRSRVFDYPGSTFTSFNEINQEGLICGRYVDSSGIAHGILARVRRTMANDSEMESQSTGISSSPALSARQVSSITRQAQVG
jgi:hypothetical protein